MPYSVWAIHGPIVVLLEQRKTKVLVSDPRCKMITLDPVDGHASPEVLQTVAKAHEGRVGVYAAVLVEGMVNAGDEITLLA